MNILEKAIEHELIGAADKHLARYLLDLSEDSMEHLELLVALTSAQVRQGNVCLPLDDKGPLKELGVSIDEKSLSVSPLVGGSKDTGKPLILDHHRLYLARYHAWEQQVIGVIKRLVQADPPEIDETLLRAGLGSQFKDTEADVDWQRVAAALAVTRRFCIISGGPGTGKTYAVARILRLLLDQAGDEGLRVALAAPTGKAAGRLTESIELADPELLEKVSQAQTLHRLLGMRPGRVKPRHGPDNPLLIDILIVDEVSMVDLPMMARLLAALPDHARLILLGDRYQLASVEAGRVMADLCGEGGDAYRQKLVDEIYQLSGDILPSTRTEKFLPGLGDCVVNLRHSRRFDSEKGIGRLAEAVNRGDEASVQEALNADDEQLQWKGNDKQTLHMILKERIVPLFEKVRSSVSPKAALECLNDLRVLCAVREGPQGVNTLNRVIERHLGVDENQYYHGRPVMVTTNDHEQQLFNGDIGLMLENEEGSLRVYFPDGDMNIRAVLPTRLPPHETLYAMTIHKSQGSEFKKVVLVLPDTESPVVTRELLYTGITRARKKVTLCATQAALKSAVRKKVQRFSGLHAALWETS